MQKFLAQVLVPSLEPEPTGGTFINYFNFLLLTALADLGGREGRTPPLGVQILSISCSFRENLACSRPPWRVHAPPSGKSWIRHCTVCLIEQ